MKIMVTLTHFVVDFTYWKIVIFHRFLYVYQKRVELPFFMVKDGAPKALKHAPMSLVIVMAQRLSLSGAHDGTLLSGTHPDLTRHGGGHCDAGIVFC